MHGRPEMETETAVLHKTTILKIAIAAATTNNAANPTLKRDTHLAAAEPVEAKAVQSTEPPMPSTSSGNGFPLG